MYNTTSIYPVSRVVADYKFLIMIMIMIMANPDYDYDYDYMC